MLLSLLVIGLLTACASNNTAITDLESKVTALEAKVEELSAASMAMEEEAHAASALEVATAQYILDTAGFHGMDEALNETKTVDPAYASTVNRVRKVVAQVAWPDELKGQGEALVGTLAEFHEALEADDGEAAATLATEAHEAQHDLSHAIDDWLGEGGDEHGN
jgi:outer membrane murein-binding lipoprotein Lpp